MSNVLEDIYSKLQEAEAEADKTTLRFSSTEVMNAMWIIMRKE